MQTLSPFTKADQQAMRGGLMDPVFATQSLFRSVMDGMARPGTIHKVAVKAVPPAPLLPLAAALLVTLADGDTPLWLDPELKKQQAVIDWLTFHIGAPIVADPDRACFAVVANLEVMPPLDQFAQGTQEYPEASTTLILQIDSVKAEKSWTLTGPGIRAETSLSVSPKPANFESQWAANGALFPRGVDIIWCAKDVLACLPRSTKLTQKGA